MKGIVSLALAASLMGSMSALAQSEHAAQAPGIAKIAGKKYYAADGASLTFFAYAGGLAREIHTADGAALVEVFQFKSDDAGTVSDSEDDSRIAGQFELTATGLAAQYNDGRSELLTTNGDGLSMMANTASGETICTSWYPEGHRFSSEERKVAMIEAADRLDLDGARALGSALRHSCDAPLGTVREAANDVQRDDARLASQNP